MENMEQSESTQTLAAAADCGNWVVVRDLLCDEDVDVADVERCLVLHKLASTSDINLSLVEDIVDEILSRDVDINMVDNNGDTAVMVAARCENWKVLWLLMTRQGALPDKDSVIDFLRIMSRSENTNKNCGLSVNILGCLWDSLKTIPECHHKGIHNVLIHVAAKVNCWWLVRDLITADTVNTLDEEGLGLVHRLAKGGMNHHIFLLHKVLENGGDINLKNADGDTAAHVAVKNKNWKMVETLLQRGARADIANNDNHTVLHTMVFYLNSFSEICKNADRIFSLLQKNFSNLDARESGWDTALQLAVKERNSLIAKKLLTFGARADVLDVNGRTVLHTMAKLKLDYSSSLLKQAIVYGAGLETKDSEGNTALHLAAKLGDWGYVNDLIAHGAIVTERDSEGCTVYDRILTNETSYIYLDIPSTEKFPLNVQLHFAVKLRRWDAFKNLLKKGANVNQLDHSGFTVLQRLAQMESMKHIDSCCGFLVNRGADITVRTPEGDNLLQLAARHKNWLVVERMLKRWFSPYEPDSEGFTVLHRLAEYRGRNLSALFRLFYNKTAVISLQTLNGDTLLQLAAKHGNIPVVEYLVQEGAVENINQVDSEGLSVIHRTVQYVQYESKYTVDNIGSVVNLLLSKGANPRLRSSVGDTALHLAAKHNNWDIVERLVELGCDLNEPDSEGFYILHRLAQTTQLRHPSRKSHKEVCQVLFGMFLTKGVNLSVRTSAGDSILQMAAKHGNWNIVERLVELECDVNELDSEGHNILHRFAQTHSREAPEDTLFRTLLNKGADLFVRTSAGDSVIQLAARKDNWNIVERLLELECDVNELDSEGLNILHRFAQTTHLRQLSYNSREGPEDILFRTLLNKGADVSVRCRTGDTALHLAVKCNNWNIVQRLAEQGCDINHPDSEGFCVLHRIVQEVLKYCRASLDPLFSILLDKGACPFVRTQSGDTVLHLVAKLRDWNTVKQLVERGANINEPDSEGFHILHRLVEDADKKILELLVAKGVNLNCKCPNIGTPLHMAVKNEKWSFAKRLVAFGADVNERDLEGLSILHIIATQKNRYRRCDCTPLIHLLITKGANVTARSPSGDSVFHLAARYDNWDIIEQILAHRNDGTDCERITICNKQTINSNGIECVVEPDSEGSTILQRLATVSNRSILLLQYLLDNGAKCDTLCPSGNSAMHLAVKHNNWYIIEELLRDTIKAQSVLTASSKERFYSRAQVDPFMEKRAGIKRTHDSKTDRKQSGRAPFNINARDSCGNTVLHLSAKAKKWDQVHTLLTCGADASLTDDEGHTVLYWLAAEQGRSINNDYYMPRILKMLRESPACTMEKDEFGDTLIQVAARNENVQVVDMLLDHLNDVNMRDSEGLTILHRVVQCTSPVSLNIVKTLIKKKANLEVHGPKGDTALHLAAQCDNWDIVRELLKNGARAGNTDSQGMYVLHRLLKQHNSCRKTATYSFLSVAFRSSSKNSKERNLPLVKLMVINGVDINTKDKDGLTALQLALIEKEWEVVQFLFKRGAEVDQNVLSEGKSFLHELAMDTSVDAKTARSVTQQLVSRGLRLNERDAQGDTPLNLAARCGNWKMVCAVLERGADASLPDNQGWFVFHRLAMDTTHPKYYEINLPSLLLLLTRNGFQVNQTGPDGKSCVQLSIEHRKWELFWWLVETQLSYVFTLQEKKTILQHVYSLTRENSDPEKVRTLILHVTEKDDSSCQELTECKHEALTISFSNCNWVVAKVLVECGADIGLISGAKPLMHLLILKYRSHDHATWLSFLDALLARGVDINSQDENGQTILYQRWRNFIVECFKFSNSLLNELLDRGASPVVADDEGRSLLTDVLVLEKTLALQSVKLLIELGVSTHQPALTDNSNIHSQSESLQASARSPTQQAFEKKFVRAFEMLVESGASSNKELFDLNTRYQVELSSRNKTSAVTQMLDILKHAASQPRSLKSLCRLTVSHALGYRPRRMDRAKSLPLPAALQDYVQFCDVLSTEVETEETQNLYFQGTEFNITDYSYDYSSPSDDEYDYEQYDYEEDNYSSYRYQYGDESDDFED